LISTGDYYGNKVSPFINSLLFAKMHPHFERQKKLDEEVLRNIKNEKKFIDDKNLYRKLSLAEDSNYKNFDILTRQMLSDKRNIEELEKQESKFKDDIDEGDEGEFDEEEEAKEIKDGSYKDKISNYFTAKSKKSGVAQALEAVSNICFALEVVVTIAEKIKNLLLWKSKSATMYVLLGLCLGYLVVTFIPLRYIIILGLLKKFTRGYTYYERVYANNIEIAKIEISRFLNDENVDLCNEWPKIKNIEKKLNIHFQNAIGIFLPNEWMSYYSRPIYLVEKIGCIKR
jgi:hypothetical protein